MSIKNNLKKYRKQAGLTQIQLAEELGISIATLRRYEAGETAPDGVMIKRIAEILDIAPENLVAGTERSNMLVFEYEGMRIEMPPDERGYEILISLIKERKEKKNV